MSGGDFDAVSFKERLAGCQELSDFDGDVAQTTVEGSANRGMAQVELSEFQTGFLGIEHC